MDLGYALMRRLLFSLDPEQAHQLTLRGAALVSRDPVLRTLVESQYSPAPDPALEVDALGLRFAHPLGLAAGLDKDGEAIDMWAALGFGFVEVGTVTPRDGQPGNEGMRIARLPADRALVNRLGFPNRGAAALGQRLAMRETHIPVGANLGKGKSTPNEEALDDYRAALRAVFSYADYLVVNVSSPNTPGLRDLESVRRLEPLLLGLIEENRRVAEIRALRPRPLLVKISPDLAEPDIDAVADLALSLGLDGIVATNTTLRHELVEPAPPIAGGLSGAPLRPRALAVTRRLYSRLEGKVPIVGVGGIMSAEDAWERVRAGAALLQTYTGLIYEGPCLIRSVVEGLSRRVAAAGLRSIAEAVGSDV